MRIDSMHKSLSSVFVLLASVLLGSCGGGGASSPGPIGGPPSIQPDAGTLYAGVEYTFTVSGGRPPYTLSSSEPTLLAVPTVVNGNFFTVVPNNTGVVDIGLAPEALPVRTVVIISRDSIGNQVSTTGIRVAQNFLTGYGVSYLSNCPTSGTSTVQACAGGETAVELNATISGNLVGNRTYRFEILRGPFFWVFGAGGQPAGNVITTATDHEGDAHVIFRVNNNVGTQIGVFRVTDVATGVSTTHVFTIRGVPVGGALEILPESVTFTGINSAQCGTGNTDIQVFDGTPPYTASSTSPNVQVTPTTSNSQPGRFTVSVSNPFTCLADIPVIVTDANNSRATFTVTTVPGENDPPPTPITATPGSLTLQCGTSGSVSIIGGSAGATAATFSASSSDPRVTATVSGRTVTITRPAIDVPPTTPASPTPGTPNPITYSVTVTNGSSVTSVGVTAPSHCPP